MGWPQQPRNIAVVNGVTTGVPTNNPGESYLNANGEFLIFDGDANLHFSPYRGVVNEVAKFRFFIGFIFWDIVLWTRTHRVHTSNNTGSLENAPGGYFDAEDMVSKFLPSNSGYGKNYFVANWFAEISKSQFSFIPVKSALAYSSGNPDLYEDFSFRNLVCTGETPFDSYFTAKGANQEHISLNDNSAEYIIDEINGDLRKPNVEPNPENLSGPEFICDQSTLFTFNACAGSISNWSVSSNLIIEDSTPYSLTVRPEYSSSRGQGFITATSNAGAVSTKNLYVGNPTIDIPGLSSPSGSNPFQFCQTYSYETQNKISITGQGFEPSSQFDWDIDTNNFGYIINGNTISIQPHTIGTIVFKVRVKNSCGWSDWAFFQYQVIDCNSTNPYFYIYPNPASEEINIGRTSQHSTIDVSQASVFAILDTKAQLFDFNGVLIKTIEIDNNATITKLDVSNLKEGMYFLKILRQGEEEVHQVIVNR